MLFKKKAEIEPTPEMVEVAMETAEKQMRENVAQFIDLQSLFVEPEQPSVIIQYGPIVLGIITLVVLFFRT